MNLAQAKNARKESKVIKFSTRTRNSKVYVTAKNDEASYDSLKKELFAKYPEIDHITSGGFGTITAVLKKKSK